MDANVVATRLSLDVLLRKQKKLEAAPCKKHELKEEEKQAMPDSTTNMEKPPIHSYHCGDDVLVLNKDGRYYLGTVVELSTDSETNNTDVPSCLVKFGDGTHSWATVTALKLLSAPPADDGRIMCVVCKRREGTGNAASPTSNAVIACDMCGRGYHAKCHTPPVDAWINGASWHCRRCVDQRYKVAAAENRALKRAEFVRLNGNRRHHEVNLLCDTGSNASSPSSEFGNQNEVHCYCDEKTNWLSPLQMILMCCRCSRWFHQECVTSLQYPLYTGDRWYIFACSRCNNGQEYLRRLELGWLELAHLALYNLTAHNARYYFDLDTVLMPYIMDNWKALQLPEKMWWASPSERREQILTALTESRKRFKCGREMKKRATIWGLRVRRPPPTPHQLNTLGDNLRRNEVLTDAVVRRAAPRLRFLPRAPTPLTPTENSTQPTSSNNGKSSYNVPQQRMIVPADNHWYNLMLGKRFHENLNSNSENDSASSYESKPSEAEPVTAAIPTSTSSTDRAKETSPLSEPDKEQTPPDTKLYTTPKKKPEDILIPCSVKIDKIKQLEDKQNIDAVCTSTHTSKIATMNLELSKLSTKNIIEHSKIMSLQHGNSIDQYYISSHIHLEHESSGDETSSRGTLDAIIPPLKDFQGKNNPFLMQNRKITHTGKKSQSIANKLFKQHSMRPINGLAASYRARMSLPMPLSGPAIRPLKRQLSEKDLIIGPNGEIKRRKHRRPRKNGQLNQSCPLPEANKTARAIDEPGAPPNLVLVHGRRLRQRQEKNYYENARRTTIAPPLTTNSVKSLQLSPHKAGAPVATDLQEMSELKSSVQIYFGAATRIRAGETFKVNAKRVTGSGATQYLIEWDGQSHGS